MGLFYRLAAQPGDLLGPDRGFNGFQHQRYPVNAWITHDGSEGVEPNIAFPQAMMTINAAGQLALGIVEVHAAQVLESYHLAELVQGGGAGFRCAQVIAGGKGVAGVDTDAYP